MLCLITILVAVSFQPGKTFFFRKFHCYAYSLLFVAVFFVSVMRGRQRLS